VPKKMVLHNFIHNINVVGINRYNQYIMLIDMWPAFKGLLHS
jgi:hypothetical protein